jgi:hypothetical protein
MPDTILLPSDKLLVFLFTCSLFIKTIDDNPITLDCCCNIIKAFPAVFNADFVIQMFIFYVEISNTVGA